ncbi:MAG: extracellular solute-binding protein [Clostridia bacterium]|nr:extracellular solute-binding protein [Clostridia bacterium]
MMKIKKICCLALAAIMLTATGCSNNETEKVSDNQPLTYWVNFDSAASMTMSELGESPFAKKLTEETGIDVQFIHPPQGQAVEKFNILIASDELPDIIEYDWTKYPGGPEKAIDDGVIVDLTDKIKEYAPNLYKYLKEHEEVDKLVKTDSGKYFAFPFIRGDRSLTTSAGLVVRKDWLDELNIDTPQTIDDWTNMLRLFKEKKNAKAPLSVMPTAFTWNAFVGAYNTSRGFYVDDGKIKYGPMQPEYKEFLKLMNSWYSEKLLDQNFGTLDSKSLDSNILNGDAGATAGSIGSGIGRWLASATESGFDLVAVPYPTLNEGEKSEFGQIQNVVTDSQAAITSSCKNIESALKLLDYGYSDEGRMLYNFGIEGESYEVKDEYPTYTDYITKNPDGLAMSSAMARYMRSYACGPFIQDVRYMEQYAALPQQQEALNIWSDTNASEHLLPILYVKQEETNEMSKLSNSISTYENEMFLKFIMGVEPIDNFDEYVAQLKQRGIDRLIEINQSAYDRYLQR